MPLFTDEGYFRESDSPRLDKEALRHFLSFCTRRKVPKKGVVIRAGDPASMLHYIVKGSVSVVHEDDGGREVVIAYLNAGDFLGELGLFYRRMSRVAMVRARTPCEIAEIEYEHLFALLRNELRDQHIPLLTAVGQQLARRLLKTTHRVTSLAAFDVPDRIASTLLDLCREPEAMSHPDGTQIHVSRQELARICGCSREMVGRVLKAMSEDGMINVSGMNIVVFHSR
jgi:CRP/FNR family cyclic AMP-dependent transcriptional regulator